MREVIRHIKEIFGIMGGARAAEATINLTRLDWPITISHYAWHLPRPRMSISILSDSEVSFRADYGSSCWGMVGWSQV